MLERQRTRSKKLEASEQGGPMMQPQSKAEGLEAAPWKVAGVSQVDRLKKLESVVHCQ
jgi:hypothetical protein